MPHKTEYISNLTPLRGIAALLVAVFHFEMAIARFVPASQTMFFEKSYLMVDLFFIMSGFIILHVYGDNFKQAFSKNSLRNFFVARFARIYPLHFFSLMLLVFLVITFAPAHILMQSNSLRQYLPIFFYYNHFMFLKFIHGIFLHGVSAQNVRRICCFRCWLCLFQKRKDCRLWFLQYLLLRLIYPLCFYYQEKIH